MDQNFNRQRPLRRKRKVFRKELFIAFGFASVLAYMLLNTKKWEQQKEQANVIQKDRVLYEWADYYQRRARWDLENG